MRDKIKDLKSQIHTAIDMFYEETGLMPFVSVETKEISNKKEKYLASHIEIVLK